MEIQSSEDLDKSVVCSDTGYSWSQEQLEYYEESWARDHDHQHWFMSVKETSECLLFWIIFLLLSNFMSWEMPSLSILLGILFISVGLVVSFDIRFQLDADSDD